MKHRKILIYSLFVGILLIILMLVGNKELREFTNIFIEIDRLKTYILSFGIWSPVVFFVIQTAQVIIAPIPGNITGLVSGAIFGIYLGFILSGSALILGSCIAFILARKYGKPLVKKIAKESTLNKYEKLSHGKISKGLFVLFLVPFIPDDILCFIVGLSAISFKKFLVILILGRLPGTFISVLIGNGILESNNKFIIIGMIVYVGIILISLSYSSKMKQLIE